MDKFKSILKTIGQFFLDIIETIVVALAIFVVIFRFVVQPHQVNGNSMWPSFLDGEYVLTEKLSYRFDEPKRGDVIIFHAPAEARCPQQIQCDFVKRIIALPNETVEISQGYIYINGELINEQYLPSEREKYTDTKTGDNFKIQLSENDYFVLGDNRAHSSDSRAWGTIVKDDIVGKAWFRYWPPKKAGIIAEASY